MDFQDSIGYVDKIIKIIRAFFGPYEDAFFLFHGILLLMIIPIFMFIWKSILRLNIVLFLLGRHYRRRIRKSNALDILRSRRNNSHLQYIVFSSCNYLIFCFVSLIFLIILFLTYLGDIGTESLRLQLFELSMLNTTDSMIELELDIARSALNFCIVSFAMFLLTLSIFLEKALLIRAILATRAYGLRWLQQDVDLRGGTLLSRSSINTEAIGNMILSLSSFLMFLFVFL